MSAVLPLLGGFLLARYVGNRRTDISVEIVLVALSAFALINSAHDFDASYAVGAFLAVIVAILSLGTFTIGAARRRRAMQSGLESVA